MKINLIIALLILSTLSLSSQEWERAKGLYDFSSIYVMGEYNGELISVTSRAEIFKLENGLWNKTKLNLPTDELIRYFKQKDNLIILYSIDGVFISTDFGENWILTKVVAENGDVVDGLKSAEIIGNKIYITRGSSPIPKCRIFEYDFNKNNWKRVKAADSDLDVVGSCFVSYKNYIVSSCPYVFKRDSLINGTYYSSDFGDTWNKVNDLKYSFSSMVIHNNIVFGTGTDTLLYKSYDFGKTWEVDKNLEYAPSIIYSDESKLYASFIYFKSGLRAGLYVSTDDGESWKLLQENLSVEGLLKYDDILYRIDGFKKLHESTDFGESWKNSEIFTDSIVTYDLYNNRDTLIAATSGNRGIYSSSNEGENWNLIGGEKDYRFSRIWKINQKDSIYVCTVLGEDFLNISTDYGLNWKITNVGISTFGYNFIKGVEFLGGDTLLIVTLFGARYSTDYGENWNEFSTEIIKSDSYITNILRLNDNTLLMTIKSVGLFRSKDNGQNWEKVETEFLTLQATQFQTFEYLNGRVYAYLPNHGLYYSVDEGQTWAEFNPKMSEKGRDSGILYYNGNIILATDDGVLISNDNGKTTKYFEISQIAQDTTRRIYINDIEINRNYLFVASTIGVYRIKLSELGIEVKSSVESEIERNYLYTYPPYPNPAKSEVKVLFYWDINIPMTADDISIYYITGKKIDAADKISIVKQESHYGNLIWDCSTAQPGIYLINIKHGTEEKAVKVVVE